MLEKIKSLFKPQVDMKAFRDSFTYTLYKQAPHYGYQAGGVTAMDPKPCYFSASCPYSDPFTMGCQLGAEAALEILDFEAHADKISAPCDIKVFDLSKKRGTVMIVGTITLFMETEDDRKPSE